MKVIKIIQHFSSSVMENVPKTLVNLQHKHFLKPTTAYIQGKQDNNFILSLEISNKDVEEITDIKQHIEIEIDPNMEVKQFIDLCKQQIPHTHNVTLYSLDKIPLASINAMDEIIQEPFYLLTDNDLCFYVTQFAGYDLDDYSYIKQYFTTKEIPLLEKNILISYLRRMDNILEQNYNTKFFVNNSESKISLDHNQLVRILMDSYLDMRNTQSDHEKGMYEQYYQLKLIKEQLQDQNDELIAQAKKLAKYQMFGGLLVLCGHFCFMGAGIYVYYDWNVMEPIGYFLNTGGMIYLSYQYFKLQGEWTHSKFSNYLINKNFTRLSKKYNFDLQQLEQVNEKIQEIQDRIKTNLVTNL